MFCNLSVTLLYIYFGTQNKLHFDWIFIKNLTEFVQNHKQRQNLETQN
jgi:hypothetical protein